MGLIFRNTARPVSNPVWWDWYGAFQRQPTENPVFLIQYGGIGTKASHAYSIKANLFLIQYGGIGTSDLDFTLRAMISFLIQ
jgi:hypothetical protein